ncbi:MAG: urease accessory protein UreE [Verrucomicrobia bacterium]|jgi:urease accessory protein|nr:urease accessory protein UreE [Verrucomicrobiota bacterium]
MNFITELIHHPYVNLTKIVLEIDRFKLSKRRWRGKAQDGVDFGFELSEPISHGTCFYQTDHHSYWISQTPEQVLEAEYASDNSDGLRVAWAIGNLHMSMQVEGPVIRVADDPAIRQLFSHLEVAYIEKMAIFQPLRVASEMGHHSHSHGPGLDPDQDHHHV